MTEILRTIAETSASIEVPTACAPTAVGDGITALPAFLPVPGMGVLPSHAYVIDGPEPMIVDAGPGGATEGFQDALASVIDPTALRWLWLTHTDPDHVGSLAWLLDTAPNLRVITTYLAVGKLGMQMQVPMDRLWWVNPGTTIDVNGRRLEAFRPPTFDAPETVAFHDHSSGTLFCADTFGAVLQRPYESADEVDAITLRDGMALWATIDAPWVTHTDRGHFDAALAGVRRFGARRVLSAHLPPAVGLTADLIDNLASVPGSEPWVGPDQAALDHILSLTS